MAVPVSYVPEAPGHDGQARSAPSIRPIIFSGPMVRALLEGRKTQTRRIMKPQPSTPVPDNATWAPDNGFKPDRRVGQTWALHSPYLAGSRLLHAAAKVRYAVGDQLYVRENFYTEGGAFGERFGYAADLPPEHGPPKLTPCIHMPRRLSRLTLTVTDVRVERLQEISADDAKAEGAGLYVPGHGFITEWERRADPGYSNFLAPRMGFEAIWSEIHGNGAWWANPWVVALTFTVEKRNVDKLSAGEAPSHLKGAAGAKETAAEGTPA